SGSSIVRRDTHAPDYVVLVAVVALTAIGVLMVYSSSAMQAYAGSANSFAVVGPQVVWGALGLLALIVMSRVDYRRLRLLSIPLYVLAVGLLILVFVPAFNRVVGGSARFLQIGPLPAVHPAEVAKLALVVYLAHWLATRGSGVRDLGRGFLPFLLIYLPLVLLVIAEPDLGTASVIALTGLVMVFIAGARLSHLAALGGLGVSGVAAFMLHGYQLERIRIWLNPWQDTTGAGYHAIQSLLALGLGGIFGAGLGQSQIAGGIALPNASNDFIFAVIGEEFGLVGAGIVIALFIILAYQGVRISLAAPDTFGALLAAGITAWLCIQAFINIAVVVAVIPITGITLPFISAGGSSLSISLAAVGILLSISRETIERGTWNDAPADRGRRNGRAHLPRAGRRPVTSR
ncbi:MAG: FtsW/RodA/SpoVE family cell cycle protein, partial [Candidatus Limnocylindrales bacterium]